MAHTVASHFEKVSPAVKEIYARLLAASRKLGPVEEDPKKTSIHLVRESAFAGVAARRETLILTLKAPERIKSPRVHKAQQTSSRRWHLDFRLTAPSEIDAEMRRWIAAAYNMS